jgi:uncharacterized repeat protein (TIGR03806 family)
MLSAYNLFRDGRAQAPNDRVVPYGLITPLFSDYAVKFRFVYVPEGKTVAYTGDGAFDFPVGSTLVKTFAYPADFRRPDEDIRLLETRLLIRRADGWVTLPYVWNAAMTDARLRLGGKRLEAAWTDAAGQRREITYRVPNKNQCKACHIVGKRITPIGPKARNLNRDFAYATGQENQLAHWARIGILAGAPPPEQAPRVARWDDPADGSLGDRARAYLDVNCGHCHSPQGPARTSGLYLTVTEDRPVHWGINKPPVAAGRGSGGLDFGIVPGKPDASILTFRMQSTDPGIMMPELGRVTVHEEGVALIRKWISGLDPADY